MSEFEVLKPLIGGMLIGLASAILMLTKGRIAGISGIFEGILMPKSGEISWRLFFISGLIIGGFAMSFVIPERFDLTYKDKDNKIKSFNLRKIQKFKQEIENTTLTLEMREIADGMKSIWSSTGEGMLVKLYVQPEISQYIKDIKLHKSQFIYDTHHDGGLEVHCTITHKLELLPQLKYWLPRIYVLEPKWLQDELMSDLEIYKDESVRFDI